MQDRDFVWDDTKAASNWLDHGITFETARAAFDDALSDDREDTRHGDTEERFALLGMVDNQFLFVSYTLRGDRIRIISALKAEPYERRRYHNANR